MAVCNWGMYTQTLPGARPDLINVHLGWVSEVTCRAVSWQPGLLIDPALPKATGCISRGECRECAGY